MILAAADFAEDPEHCEPPRELELMFECQRFPGALYMAGGLGDQPAGLVRRMRAALTVFEAVRAWKAARVRAEWCEQNPGEWRVVQKVLKMREVEKGKSRLVDW